MDLSPAISWDPPDGWQRLTVIESHTGGEPFRVVVDGLPDIPGDSVLEKRRYAMENLDHLRRATMWEPRGHADMYGGWVGDPVDESSDLSVLFLHNEGFSTMCGHGIIALAKVVIDTGIILVEGESATLRIDTPAGQVVAEARVSDGAVTQVSFLNVPSFALELDASVEVPGIGTVPHDLAFGGGFYAYVEAGSIGMRIDDPAALTANGRAIKEAIAGSRDFFHPGGEDLGFLYGVIFTGPAQIDGNHSRHAAVFADGEIDRSPTGTGVSGRLSILHARGEVDEGEAVAVESLTGSRFVGRIVGTARVADWDAVIPEVTGSAHILGRAEYWFDPTDEIGRGFLLR